MSGQNNSPAPLLLYFQEIRSGDLKKQRAEATVDLTRGGGARDMRMPQDYWPILEPMFPEPGSEPGVRSGIINGFTPAGPESHTFELWPPTSARPTEIRIGRIHELHGWAVDETSYNDAQAAGHKWFYVLEKYTDGTVQARLLKEEQLDSEPSELLRHYLRERIRHTPPSRTIRGSIDFQTRSFYP